MTTLVTGASGFACSHVVHALAQVGERVVALDLVPPDGVYRHFLGQLQDRVRFVTADVLDSDVILGIVESFGVRRFIHGAAITPTEEMERARPHHIVNVNLIGTVRMLEVARTVSADRFVLMSSSGVYAPVENKDALVTERSPVKAEGLYTICKITGEQILKRYKRLFGLSTVSGRMSSIYGPMERATATRTRPSVIYSLVRACLLRQPVRVRGVDFRRCFTHAEDAGQIWRQLALAPELQHDVYNVTAGAAYSLNQALAMLGQLEPSFAYFCPDHGEMVDVELTAEGDRGELDVSRAKAEFGFTPKYDLRQGLASYLAWAQENQETMDL
jgi:nucleoside-diphosphate-sugar epimerase